MEELKEFKKAWNYLNTDTVEIILKASYYNDILEYPKGDIQVLFKTMTYGDYAELEKKSGIIKDKVVDDIIETSDFLEFRKLILGRMLLKWNLGLELKFKDDELTKSCYQRVLSLPAKLISSLVEKYEESFDTSKDEITELDKQSAVLFGKHSHGVKDACEGISQYCVLTSFWEKFGLNRFDLQKMPYKEFIDLRIILKNEADAHNRQMKADKNRANSNVRTQKGMKTVTVPSEAW